MFDARFFLNQPVPFQKICIIYPPTVNEITCNPAALTYAQLLTQSQEDLEDLVLKNKITLPEGMATPEPLYFLLKNCYASPEYLDLIQKAFAFFIREPVTPLYETESFIIGSIEEITHLADISKARIINKQNFFEFQNLIRQSMGYEEIAPIDPDEEPEVARIKMLGRRRERIAKKNKTNKKGVSFTTNLAAICCMNVGITPLNIGEVSYAAMGVLSKLYQQKEKYDFEMRCITAGADPKKLKVQYWIREQSEFNEVHI